MGIVLDNLPKIEALPGGTVALATSDFLINWGRTSSMWPLTFGLACCAIEMMAAYAARFDFERMGVFPRPTPRQADVMFVAGTVSKKMAGPIIRIYKQMPEPRFVIAMGGCANCGGPFYDSYAVVKGVDKIIPVDVYIPGCPPRPEALMYAVLKLHEKIRKMQVKKDHGATTLQDTGSRKLA